MRPAIYTLGVIGCVLIAHGAHFGVGLMILATALLCECGRLEAQDRADKSREISDAELLAALRRMQTESGES